MEAGKSVLVDHAAELLGVSRRTVYYRIRNGLLHTIRMGVSQRVLLDSIEALGRARPRAKLPSRSGVTGDEKRGVPAFL